jgi:hypothetical protein
VKDFFDYLAENKSITTLKLNMTQLKGGSLYFPDFLAKNKTVINLELRHNIYIDELTLKAFETATSLHSLDLDGSRVNEAELRKLKDNRKDINFESKDPNFNYTLEEIHNYFSL